MKAEGKATAKEPKNVVLQSWVYVFIYLIFYTAQTGCIKLS